MGLQAPISFQEQIRTARAMAEMIKNIQFTETSCILLVRECDSCGVYEARKAFAALLSGCFESDVT